MGGKSAFYQYTSSMHAVACEASVCTHVCELCVAQKTD